MGIKEAVGTASFFSEVNNCAISMLLFFYGGRNDYSYSPAVEVVIDYVLIWNSLIYSLFRELITGGGSTHLIVYHQLS